MGLFTAFKTASRFALISAKANLDGDDAAVKADKARAAFILLECAEADIAREASREQRLGPLLLALRNSISAWKDAHLAYETAAKACQAVSLSIDAFCQTFDGDAVTIASSNATNIVSLSEAAHARAINVHNELRLAGKVLHTLVLPPMPGVALAVKADLLSP